MDRRGDDQIGILEGERSRDVGEGTEGQRQDESEECSEFHDSLLVFVFIRWRIFLLDYTNVTKER